MRFRGLVLLVAVAGLGWGAPALAQDKGSWELGYDMGVTFGLFEGDDATSFGVPASGFTFLRPQTVRAGYFASAQSEFEPRFGFGLLNVMDETVWSMELGLDYLHNFPKGDATPFVRFGPAVWVIHEPDVTESQVGLEAGVGVRPRLGDNAALRLQAGVSRFFENEQLMASHWDVQLSLGLSFFAK